jgi:hypothetical protein
MQVHKEGSLVVLMLGLFWLAGIMTMVLYAMVSHLSTLAAIREVELQHWYLIQGGMQTALAHINDAPELYLQEQGVVTLYEGPFYMKEKELTLNLLFQKGLAEGEGLIKGVLKKENTIPLIHLFWHITYAKTDNKWRFVSGERIYDQ